MKIVLRIATVSLTLIATVWLSSCDNNFKEVQKSTIAEFTPTGEADTINLKYTDSGRIKSVLIAPKMLDYAAVKFPFTEFPKGLNITIYDTNGKTTNITANYGVSFKDTKVIDLRGNVKIANDNGQVFKTEQLYFDQINEWFYTDNTYNFDDPKGKSTGEGVDFRKDLKIINSQRISGEIQKSE